MSNRSTRIVALAFLAGLSLSACGRDGVAPTEGPPSGAVASVEVSPTGGTLARLGATLRLSAVARDRRGNVIRDQPFVWRSSDTKIATVDDAGLVTATGHGVASISAAVAGVSGEARVDVQIAPLTLTDSEAEEIAQLLAASAIGAFEYGFGRMVGPPSGAVAANDPVEIIIDFQISRGCPEGGDVVVSGTLDAHFDLEERRGEFALEAAKSVNDCQFVHGDVLIVLRTEPDQPIGIHASGFRDGSAAEAIFQVEGVLFIKRGDEDEEPCEIDLTVSWSIDTGWILEGMVCGRTVGDDEG